LSIKTARASRKYENFFFQVGTIIFNYDAKFKWDLSTSSLATVG